MGQYLERDAECHEWKKALYTGSQNGDIMEAAAHARQQGDRRSASYIRVSV
jgi:hypothetical protein